MPDFFDNYYFPTDYFGEYFGAEAEEDDHPAYGVAFGRNVLYLPDFFPDDDEAAIALVLALT